MPIFFKNICSSFLNFIFFLIISSLLILSLLLTNAKASVLMVNNMDAAGKGFNDSATFIPVGGNNATTLGQARLIAFQYAADKIASLLSGNHVITIDASMASFGGTSTQATLGGAGAVDYVYDFSGAPEKNVLYPIALANKFFGQDINPLKADIRAIFNCDIDSDEVLTGSRWYYGLDEQSSRQDIDFVTVVMHELIHGLGFSSTIDLATGSKADGRDDVYSRYLYHVGINPPSYADMTDQQRMWANISTNLHWNGSRANQQAQQRLTAGLSNNRVEMFAPIEPIKRSSLSHFSSDLKPDEMMEPFYTAANHDLGLATSVLSDIGWGSESDLAITVTAQAVDALSFINQYRITVRNNGPDNASEVSVASHLLEGRVLHQETTLSVPINCEQNDQGIVCQLGDIKNGAQVSYTLTTVRNSLNQQQFKNSIVANIVDITVANNEKIMTIDGVAARSNVEADVAVGVGGGGGMMSVFFLIILLSIVFIHFALRVLSAIRKML